MYSLKTKNNLRLNPKIFKEYGIKPEEIYNNGDIIIINLTQNQADKINKLSEIDSLTANIDKNQNDNQIFPFSDSLHWNRDNLGVLIIPKKGIPIKLDLHNLPIYKRLISVYEQNDLKIVNNDIIINNNKTDIYIPKMDYYFIICDNRDNAFDSRYWGFLPENHIYGKILKIFK